MNQGLFEKNWRKITYFNDFIAIKRTVNRLENRDKIVHFYGILDDMDSVISYDVKSSILSKFCHFWWLYFHPQKNHQFGRFYRD
jgi:hypothetical protein